MGLGHSPKIATNGLVMSLDAGNPKSYPGSGDTWFNLYTPGPSGTLLNGPTYSSSEGGYFSFDGTNDYVNMNPPAVGFSPNRWTICTWMKPNNHSSRFLTPNSNGIDQYLQYTSGVVSVVIASSQDTNQRGRSGTAGTIPVGQWSYSCVSIDDLTIKIYANGVLTNEYTETLSIGNWSGAWRLGQRGNSTNWYSGLFSNFTVYNRALSESEVAQNFQALRGRYGI